MSILSAIRQQSGSIDDLAKLPQAMIMQMAQKKQIATEMVAPILARKAEMIDAAAKARAMQGGVPKTSVMEQIMAQNVMAEQPQQMPQQMPEMENMGVAQLPVPERMYAGGGIVAFARGSLIDDDEEIDPFDDYAKAAAMAQKANAMPVGMPSTMPVNAPAAMPVNAPAVKPSILPQSYEAALAEKGQTPASVRKMMIDSPKKGDYVMPPIDVPKRGGHKYEDMVIKEAQRLGVDPSLALHVLYKETGNIKNPETAKSSAGALGVMQLMPKTAKGLGVDPLNPEENIRGGVTYLKQMYDRYQDPTLALAAYNAGPGRLDKALKSGQGIAGLPQETQKYVIAGRMASGGEVRYFENGGQPRVGRAGQAAGSNFFPESQRSTAAKKKRTLDTVLDRPEYLGLQNQIQGEQDERAALPIEFNTAPVPMDRPTYQELGYTPPANESAAATKTAMDLFLEQNAADREALGKQRIEDRNMALLAAGLGMLGGESPYAFSNIGKGGLSGVSYLSEANKQRAAQQAALDKNRIAAMHYQNIGDYYKSQTLGREEKLALQQKALQDRQYERSMAEITRINTAIENAAKNNVAQMKGIEELIDPAKRELLMQKEIARLQAIAEPQLTSLYKTAGINMPNFSPMPSASVKDYKLVK